MSERDEERREPPADAPAPTPPRRDGWAEHAERQRRDWQTTTPRQRLEWLEGAKRLAKRAQEAAKRRSE
jgi:hypothetical protein